MITTFKFSKTAETVIDEINSGVAQQYSPAEKAEAIAVINHSKEVVLQLVADGDTKKEYRRKLSSDHQKLIETLRVLQDEPEPIPSIEEQIEAQRRGEVVVFGIFSFCFLIYILCFS